jgi:hypothetical protein
MKRTEIRFELTLGLALALILAVGSPGCGGEEPTPSAPEPKAGPVQPPPLPVERTPPAPPAQEAPPAVDTADLIPSSFPIYPGAEEGQMMNAGGSAVAQYLTDDSVDEVYTFYAAELPKQGWEIQQDLAASKRIIASNQGRGLSVALIRIDDKTEIGVMITAQQ